MFFDIQQNTDEWLNLRIGKVTGSEIGKIMAQKKDKKTGKLSNAFGDPAKKYAVKLAVEQLTSNRIDDGYSNAHMDRGHTQEPIARALYEELKFCDVLNGGFFDNKKTGCSPDGLVNDNGMIEIKSVIYNIQYATIKRQKFDPCYKWQLTFNLKESKRDWIDYISYCSQFPEDRQLFIQRLTTDDFKEEFEKIDIRLEEFFKLVKTNKEMILNQ